MVKDAKKTDDKEYSVTSKSSRTPKSVTFHVPTVSRPRFTKPNLPLTSNNVVGLVLAFFIVALLSGFGGGLIANRSQNGGLTSGSVSNQKKIVSSQSQLISQIAKTVGPSVVSVNVSITDSSSGASSGFGLYGFSQPESEQAAGTGIIISSSGLIVTNRHVVPVGTTNVSVTLSDGTELKDVTVVGRTNSNDSLDVAFLKIGDAKGHKLSPATIGDSSKVEVGDDVVAIGNALGQFQNTVTSGIISGYGRSVTASDSSGSSSSAENLDDLFQTDAAINEGNSGGPLVNLNGQVIGINTATAGNAQNIGFSIPINDLRGLIDQVIKSGKFARPYLGVRYVPLTADIAKEFGLSVEKGAFVAPSSDSSSPSVIADSPADKAGVQEKDIITALDDTPIDQSHSLTSILSKHQPGDKVTLTIQRDGKVLHLDATVGTVPSTDQ